MRLLHVLSLSLLTASVSFAQEISKEIKVLDYRKSGRAYYRSSSSDKQYIANALANGYNKFFNEAFNHFNDEVNSEEFKRDLAEVKRFVKSYLDVKRYDQNNPKIKKLIKDLNSFHVILISNEKLLLEKKEAYSYNYFKEKEETSLYERRMRELGYAHLAYIIKIKTKSLENGVTLENHIIVTKGNNLDQSVKEALDKIILDLKMNAVARIDSIIEEKRNLKILDDYSVSIDDSNRENMKDSGNKPRWWEEALGKEKKAWLK